MELFRVKHRKIVGRTISWQVASFLAEAATLLASTSQKQACISTVELTSSDGDKVTAIGMPYSPSRGLQSPLLTTGTETWLAGIAFHLPAK